MIKLSQSQLRALHPWFIREGPGRMVGQHVVNSGHGTGFVDRWPDPRVVLVDAYGQYTLRGNPAAISAEDIRRHVKGILDAPESFERMLRAAFPDLAVWPRLVHQLEALRGFPHPQGVEVRRLTPKELPVLEGLSPDLDWISRTWGGPATLAKGSMAWGALAGGRLVSVAASFFVGERYEDIGVVTEADYRGRNLAVVCAAELCKDIIARGRVACWTTSPDNIPSLRAAEKLGFKLVRQDAEYLLGVPVPQPATPPESASHGAVRAEEV